MSNDLKAKRLAIFKLLVIAAIIIVVPVYIMVMHPEVISFVKDPARMEAFLNAHRTIGIPLFIALNIFQVLCSLPGQVFQLAGGYVFGFFLGLLLSVIGVAIGASCAFFIAHKLGNEAIHTLFGEAKVTQHLDQLNSKKGVIVLFVAYLIPGMPKDLFNYVAGLSDIRYKPFIIICMAGRLPGMCASLLIGNQVVSGQYTSAIIVAIIVLILCALGLLFRHRIVEASGKFYDKFS